MPKLLLISPPSPYRDIPDPNGLPLGLCMVASAVRDTPKNRGRFLGVPHTDIKIIDSYSHALTQDETIAQALRFDPDIVGISLPFSFLSSTGLRIASMMKSESSEIITILGGLHASLKSDDFLKNPSIDAILIGEAEETSSDLLRIFSKSGWHGVSDALPPGLKIIDSSGDIQFTSRPLIDDLDSLPFPAFDLLPEFPEFYQPRLMTSRGCGFRCPYCSSSAYWGHTYRAQSPERVVSDVLRLKQDYGVIRVSFSDDNFNQIPSRARRIAEMMIEKQCGIEWGTSCRPELLTEDDLILFHKAGMSGLFLGLESGSAEILRSINRAHDPEKIRSLIGYAEKLGIHVHASFMIGLPDERESDIEMTLDYAKSLPASSLGFHIFHPLPGCEIAENPDKYGITYDLPEGNMEMLGAIDAVAPIRTRYLSSMRILDYYYIARGIIENRKDARLTT